MVNTLLTLTGIVLLLAWLTTGLKKIKKADEAHYICLLILE